MADTGKLFGGKKTDPRPIMAGTDQFFRNKRPKANNGEMVSYTREEFLKNHDKLSTFCQ